MNNEFEIGQGVVAVIGGQTYNAGEAGKVAKIRKVGNEYEYLVSIQRRKMDGIQTINVWIVEEQLCSEPSIFSQGTQYV